MREYPILFSGEMVRALLDGRKTQTRRVIKPQPTRMAYAGGVFSMGAIGFVGDEGKTFLCPYGKPGDRLWVRETWAPMCRNADPICQCTEDYEYRENHYIEYRADTGNPYPGQWPIDEARGNPDAPKWCPSIHMPRWASRITLDVVRVRVERLQEISRDDAIAEGLYSFTSNLGAKNSSPVRFYSASKGDEGGYMNPVEAFENLWDSINAKRGYGWDVNPWVWVIEFNTEVRHD